MPETSPQTIDTVAAPRLDLTTLSDEHLGMLAAYPMDAEHWTLLEDEITRRVLAGQTDEWSLS